MADYPAIATFRFPDLAAARDFYVDQLGFTVTRDDQNLSIAFGAAQIMLEGDESAFYGDLYNRAIAERRGQRSPNALYIEAPGLDELYQRCLDRQIRVVDSIGSRPWGQREFTVEDPAGNFLSFWEREE